MMKKFTYLDVALADPKLKTICQLGLVCQNYDTDQNVYPELEILINPESEFSPYCTAVHGITFERVKYAQMLPEVWDEVEKYLESSVIVGHNLVANALDALERGCDRYELVLPEMYYLCTRELAEEFIPKGEVSSYNFTDLCRHFEIPLTEKRSAYDDALANKQLLKKLVDTYEIDLESHIKKFEPSHGEPSLAEIVSELYGVLAGFVGDGTVTPAERSFITQWAYDHEEDGKQHQTIARILEKIDDCLADGVIDLNEMNELKELVKYDLQLVSGSYASSATQVLQGLMKGVAADGVVTVEECHLLRDWLYDNIHLTGHFAFDRLMATVETVLEDGELTPEESEEIAAVIRELV